MPKLLLHTCCAPCLIYPLMQLRQEGFEVTGVFYNPNIHPLAEYNNRMQAVEGYSKKAGVEVIYPDYKPGEFFLAMTGGEEKRDRCPKCWYQRLKITAQIAKERGFTYFSTTLLVSPYQDQESLKQAGSDIAVKEGIEFYFEDFRPGFRKAHDLAKSEGIYCQKYCGCVYSTSRQDARSRR